jgi:membrane protease subunit HflC
MLQRHLLVVSSLILILLLGLSCFYVVDARQQAVLLRMGQVANEGVKPGIHLKFPLLDKVLKFDSRLQTMDIKSQEVTTADQKTLKVDYYIQWQIQDIGQYYRATAGNDVAVARYLDQAISDNLKNVLKGHEFKEIVAGGRDMLIQPVMTNLSPLTSKLGIKVSDVRIRNLSLPQEDNEQLLARMEQEQKELAKQRHALGQEEAERVRAEAQRQREVALAEAYRDAERIRGDGDAQAAAIYAQTYQQDPEFYAFYRSMQAYRKAFLGKDKKDLIILNTEGDFFRYFNSPESGK